MSQGPAVQGPDQTNSAAENSNQPDGLSDGVRVVHVFSHDIVPSLNNRNRRLRFLLPLLQHGATG